MDKPTLEEARLKFPIGTKFNNKNLGLNCDNIEITGTKFYTSHNSILVDINSNKSKEYNSSNYTVWMNGVWAEITHPVLNQEPNYEIY